MTRKLIIILFACVATICSNGQKVAFCDCDSLYSKMAEPRLTGDLFVDKIKSPVSPYFIDDWLDGTILLSNSVTVKSKNLRYNGYIDRLIWLTKDFKQVKLDKEMVDGFSLQDIKTGETYHFRKIKIMEQFALDSAIVYAQVLYENHMSLFAYRKMALNNPGVTQSTQNIFDLFEKEPAYYFKFHDDKLAEVRHIKKRNITKLFPGKEEQVKNLLSAAKQHRVKTEEDLIKIAKLLDGMK